MSCSGCSAVKAGLVTGVAAGALASQVGKCDAKQTAGAAVAGFLVGAGLCSICGCGTKKTTNELVTESWATVKSAFTLEQVGALFYKNLFEQNPGLKESVFGSTDHGMQPKKLMTFIDTGLSLLDQPEKLVPVLVKCGERHGAYGLNGNFVEPEHYPAVGGALLTTLAQGLGDKFTPEVKQAWTDVYGVIQAKMIEGQTNAKGQSLRAAAKAK